MVQRAQTFLMLKRPKWHTKGSTKHFDSSKQIASVRRRRKTHVQHLQKLVPAFDNLYNAMPEQQKKLTDQVFRANAGRHAAQSGHGTNATATAK
jgi:hypothetical protein